jgi:hypothetical protein
VSTYSRTLILADEVNVEQIATLCAGQHWELAADLPHRFGQPSWMEWSVRTGTTVAYVQHPRGGTCELVVQSSSPADLDELYDWLRGQVGHVDEAMVTATALRADDPFVLLRALTRMFRWDRRHDGEAATRLIERAIEHPSRTIRCEGLQVVWSRRGEPIAPALQAAVERRLPREDDLRDGMARLLEAMGSPAAPNP